RRIENEAAQIGAGQNISEEAARQLAALNKRIGTAMGGNKKGLGSVQRIDHTEHARLMLDLIALAFWTDSTRVATFMFGNAVSGKNFSFLDGVSGSHHSISHHKGDQKQLDQYQRINTWHSAQLAYLLKAMKSLPEGNANVLDNSMVLFGSGIRDGNAHATKDIPVVLAGGANGQLKTGRHLKADDNAPLASLYVGMMKRMGVPTKSIGNASNELRGL
ncbi:MAG: DUF1552 domain-containing protein, partial [Verrucomicrobiales bacterium]